VEMVTTEKQKGSFACDGLEGQTGKKRSLLHQRRGGDRGVVGTTDKETEHRNESQARRGSS